MKANKKSAGTQATVFACKLSSAEFRQRKEEVLDKLKEKIVTRKPIKNGFRFTLSGSDSTFVEVMDFIKAERECCSFLTFDLRIQDRDSQIALSITGPKGAKDFIADEMGL